MKRLRNFINTTLLGGFIVLLPLAIFVLIAQALIGIIKNILHPLSIILEQTLDVALPPVTYDIIALIVVIILFFALGLIVKTQFGKGLFDGFERHYLSKLPFYSTIKKTVQQFTGFQKMPFSEVVLADVFGNGVLMTGFITDTHPGGYYTLFVPTAPNPTNGFIFHVGEEQIKHIKQVKTEDAMRTIIGMGVGTEKVFDMQKEMEEK